MTNTLHAHPVLSQSAHDLAFDPAGDGDAAEGAVDVAHAGEGAGAAFREELGGVGG